MRIDGDQVIRITFHRGAGGIIQDIEIPPDMICPQEISVPIGTKRFTLTGWGGQSLVPEGLEIGPATITFRLFTLNKTTVGFQRNSVINQIGPYRVPLQKAASLNLTLLLQIQFSRKEPPFLPVRY